MQFETFDTDGTMRLLARSPCDVAVTRHPNLIEVLRERGIINEDTPVLTHVADVEQIRGLHVVGVLPHHLSSRAASITEIPMRWTEADRVAMQKGDLDLDSTRAAAGDPVTYIVEQDSRPVGPPISKSNLTDLEDLAAAAYSVQATSPILWADLTPCQRDRWVTVTEYLLDICLPPEVHNQSADLQRIRDRARADGHGARRVAEAGLGLEADHQASLARIRAER